MAAVVEQGTEQAAEPLDRRRMNLVFVTILVGMLLAALDQTVVSTALPIVAAYAHAVHVVFLLAVPVPLVALVLALFLKEIPLRETARGTARDVGEGFNMPESGDAKQQLQMAIGRLLQRKGHTHLPLVREKAGVTLSVADQWAVGQVYLRTRLGRPATVEEISVRYRLPGAVLEPAFAEAVRHGCLSADGDAFLLTELGQQEVAKYVAAMRAWLAEELADWGADDAQLGAALGDLATRFVEQSPELTAGPPGVLTTTRAP